jgi:hypothetical protein
LKDSRLGLLFLLMTIFTSSGASCRYLTRQNEVTAPIAFVGPPTLEDVIYAVNTNSAKVRQLSTQSGTLTTPGAPSLRATLDLERPRNFRLRAKLITQELDVGSNDQRFWMWTKSDPDRSIYFAFHDNYGAAAAQQGMPVGPDWLIEAIGLVQLEPGGQHEGPITRADQNIEIRSRLVRNGIPFTRVMVIDRQRGWILEQQLWDMTGRSLALARCSNFRFYQNAGASLPHRIQVELPTAQLSFQIEVGEFVVNQLQGDASLLWDMPTYEGYQQVNLAEMPLQVTPASSGYPPGPRTSYRPRYRGLTTR